jgi:hypothetical protein
MNPLVPLVMFGWIPAVLYLFMRFSAQWPIVASFITAWLFLPLAEFPLPGLPDYTKMSATCYGILLATVIFDAKRFSSFQLSWLDLPMLIWCVCPFASSITNSLGPYDGFSTALLQTVTWGVPYFLGRIYLNDLNGLRRLAIGIFAGGLIYIPLCLVETRIGPQLHLWVYGFTQTINWGTAIRYGGYRPTVFMETGLMVGAWMMAAALIGIWLWKAGVIRQLWGVPISWLVAALLVTNILVKSTGALILLAIGFVILFIAKWFRNAFVLLLLIGSMSFYLYLGISGTFFADQVVSSMHGVFPEERVESLEFRFNNEELLSDKARERIVFGWGGWGRNRVYDEWGKDISITDSLWIIAFGANGAVGLISLTASLLLPVIGFLQRYPASLWFNPKVAPAAALTVLLTLYMLDCLLNAMINPIYTLVCGGIAGVALTKTRTSKVVRVSSSVMQRYLV